MTPRAIGAIARKMHDRPGGETIRRYAVTRRCTACTASKPSLLCVDEHLGRVAITLWNAGHYTLVPGICKYLVGFQAGVRARL
jgi:hypothetical protein